MSNATPDKIKQLASRYDEACKHLRTVTAHNSASDSEFFKIIHNPGWTTLIDVELASGILEAFEQQTRAAAAMNKALVAGARGGLGKAAGA